MLNTKSKKNTIKRFAIGIILIGLWVLVILVNYSYKPNTSNATNNEQNISINKQKDTVICPGQLKLATDQLNKTQSYDPNYDPNAGSSESVLRAFAVAQILTNNGDNKNDEYQYTNQNLSANFAYIGSQNPLALNQLNSFYFDSSPINKLPTLINANATQGNALLGGASFYKNNNGDLRGIASNVCVAPNYNFNFIGGSTANSNSTRITLINPNSQSVNIEINAYSESGKLSAPALSGIVLPPFSQRAVLLEGVIPNQKSLALNIKSTGGQFVAFLQTSILNKLTSKGVSFIQNQAQPSKNQFIQPIRQENFLSKNPNILRLFSPNKAPTSVELAFYNNKTQSTLYGIDNITLNYNQVKDIELSGIEKGDWVVQVKSSKPILSSIKTISKNGNDFSWSPASELEKSGILILPPKEKFSAKVIGFAQEKTSLFLSFINSNGDEIKNETVQTEQNKAIYISNIPDQAVQIRWKANSPQGQSYAGLSEVISSKNMISTLNSITNSFQNNQKIETVFNAPL